MNTRRARASMALRFLARSLALRGAPFLLALVAVTTAATVTATMLNLEADVGAKMSTDLRRYGPNLLLLPGASGGDAGAERTLDERAVRGIPALLAQSGHAAPPTISLLLLASATVGPGKAARRADEAIHETASGGPAVAAGRNAAAPGESIVMGSTGAPTTVVGCEFDAVRTQNPSWRIEGAWPARAEAVCVVGVSVARRAGLQPGQQAVIAIDGRAGLVAVPAEVAGIVSTGESADEQVFLPLPIVQAGAGAPGRVSLAALAVDGGPGAVDAAAERLRAALPGTDARPLRQIAAAQGEILGKLGRMMGLLTAVVLALSALCLTTTLMSIVIEREREIGLMRSIGASDWEILAMFLGEVSLLGVLGGIAGLGLGAAASRLIGARLFDAAIDARLAVCPIVVGASVALCLLSVLVPVRRALAIQPAAALRGE